MTVQGVGTGGSGGGERVGPPWDHCRSYRPTARPPFNGVLEERFPAERGETLWRGWGGRLTNEAWIACEVGINAA